MQPSVGGEFELCLWCNCKTENNLIGTLLILVTMVINTRSVFLFGSPGIAQNYHSTDNVRLNWSGFDRQTQLNRRQADERKWTRKIHQREIEKNGTQKLKSKTHCSYGLCHATVNTELKCCCLLFCLRSEDCVAVVVALLCAVVCECALDLPRVLVTARMANEAIQRNYSMRRHNLNNGCIEIII